MGGMWPMSVNSQVQSCLSNLVQTVNHTDSAEGGSMDEARAWIEGVLGEKLGMCSLQEELKDGVALGGVLNAIQPGIVPRMVSSSVPYKQMHNVEMYLATCKMLGVKELFSATDLLHHGCAARARPQKHGGGHRQHPR
eukprot:7308742-Prymnesium_polylepis.1